MKASVLLPTYNHQDYISIAIESIVKQDTSFAFEIIIMDDSSTDNTFTIAQELNIKYPNIRLVRNEKNLGITKNYQKGFKECSGEYIFILEGDDYWIDTRKMQKQIDFMDSHPYHSLCFHPFIVQEDDTSVYRKKTNHNYNLYETFSVNNLIMDEGLIANFSVCCYRKSLIDKLPEKLFETISYDWIINTFMGDYGLLGLINEEMSVYRHSKTAQWSKKTHVQQITEIIELISQYDKLLDYRYTDIYKSKTKSLQHILKNADENKINVVSLSKKDILITKMINFLQRAKSKK